MADPDTADSKTPPFDVPEILEDRGGRRRLPDRRQSTSSEHFPERRSFRHRRNGSDRRLRQHLNIRKKIERRRVFKDRYDAENLRD
jgi:hypothetical protein